MASSQRRANSSLIFRLDCWSQKPILAIRYKPLGSFEEHLRETMAFSHQLHPSGPRISPQISDKKTAFQKTAQSRPCTSQSTPHGVNCSQKHRIFRLQVTMYHTLPQMIPAVIQKTPRWILAYRIPAIYIDIHRWHSGILWSYNIYICI